MKDLLKKTLSIAETTLMLVFVLCGAALAQEVTGGIVGTVRDPNGAAVVNATVKSPIRARATVSFAQ